MPYRLAKGLSAPLSDYKIRANLKEKVCIKTMFLLLEQRESRVLYPSSFIWSIALSRAEDLKGLEPLLAKESEPSHAREDPGVRFSFGLLAYHIYSGSLFQGRNSRSDHLCSTIPNL